MFFMISLTNYLQVFFIVVCMLFMYISICISTYLSTIFPSSIHASVSIYLSIISLLWILNFTALWLEIIPLKLSLVFVEAFFQHSIC